MPRLSTGVITTDKKGLPFKRDSGGIINVYSVKCSNHSPYLKPYKRNEKTI